MGFVSGMFLLYTFDGMVLELPGRLMCCVVVKLFPYVVLNGRVGPLNPSKVLMG